MTKRRLPVLNSLSAQMIVAFVGLVALMASAAGVPAVWLIRAQLDRQAWAQVEQGHLAAQALYAAAQDELVSLATLTAQRPTLLTLLAQGDQGALSGYLTDIQQGSGLDLVVLCDAGHAIVQVGLPVSGNLCSSANRDGFAVLPGPLGSEVWLLASQPVAASGSSVTVTVARALDDGFARRMRDRSGLEHTLLVDGQPAASSFAARLAREPVEAGALPEGSRGNKFDLAGEPYYADRFSLAPAGLEAEVALPVSAIFVTQWRLLGTLVGSILIVAVVASLLGTFLARRISGPLDRLVAVAQGAEAIRQDSEGEPLSVEAGVREVALVAQALEGARSDLKSSLAELRQEKAWVDHLLEAIVEGIVTLDRRGRLTFFSNGAERITGWRRDEVLGQSCDRVFRPLESHQPFSQLIPPPGGRRKILVAFPDDHQAVLAITGAQLLPPEGGDARVALVFRDVSEEEAMHRLLAHFLANIAHEFRTPLSALAASVELLLDQAPDLSGEELHELLTSLHLGVLGLQTLIDNLLESASIESGHFRVTPRPCNLGEVIADAIATMQPLLDKHGQRLVVELPAAVPVVQADPRRTVQVLVNLLSNASKYGPDDAEIEVDAALRENWVRVNVVDCGPGVPLEQRQELFRRFVHPNPQNGRAQVGVGLGLSVVKAVVEAHGGQVGIEDRPAGGSVFWFTLPVAGGRLDSEP